MGRNSSANHNNGIKTAQGLHDLIIYNIGAIDKPEFSKEIKNINAQTVLPALNKYEELSKKHTPLMIDVITERGASRYSRKNASSQIYNALCEKGSKSGINTIPYKELFNEELNKQFAKFVVNPDKLNNLTEGLKQGIYNKKEITKDEKKAILNADKKNFEQYTINLLSNKGTNALKSFTEQTNANGMFGKIAEQVSKLWNSNNIEPLVQKDIEKYNKDVYDLRAAKNHDEFKNKFKEIFKVDYDEELIAKCKDKENALQTTILANAKINFFEETFKDLLNERPLENKIKVYTSTGIPIYNTQETKKQTYEKNYKAYAKYLGYNDEEQGKKELEKKFKEYHLKPEASIEEKYAVMQRMAKKEIKELKYETKAVTKSKSIEEAKKEYVNSYYAAFGTENDIAKRVSDYNISQKLGQSAAESLILSPIVIGIGIATGGAGLIPALKSGAITTGLNLAAYSTDRLMSKNGMTKDDISRIVKFSVLDGSTSVASALALDGIKFFTSSIFQGTSTAAKTAAKITEIGMLTAAETANDAIVQKYISSKVEIDGVAYSATFSLAGQLLDIVRLAKK
ncbi:hypothetical protein IJ818_01385 [bacterium]|nr:hypothetical protein [bacterium]